MYINRRRALIVSALFCSIPLIMCCRFQNVVKLEVHRRGNKRRRDHFEEKIESWNDREFKSQTSLSRMLFNLFSYNYRAQIKEESTYG